MSTKNEIVVNDRRFSSIEQARPLDEKDLTDASLSTLERAQVLRTPAAMQVAEALESIGGRPIGDRILVLPLPPDDHHGAIIIPDIAQEDQCCGIVVSVGKGRYEQGVLVPPDVEPGNYVVFSKYAARKVKIGRIEVYHIAETDISFAAGK